MKILLTGSLSIDQIMNFDGLFESMIHKDKLDVLSISVLIQNLRRTRGGIAGNIAYSLALLGEQPILYGSIGKEQKTYMKFLARKGVNIDHVHYSDLPTATFSVITDKNNCQVGGFYPGAMGDAATLTLEPFANQDVLTVISAHDPAQMEVQIDACMRMQKPLCFDVGQQVIILPESVLHKGVEAAKLLILNEYEMGVLSSRIGKSIEEIIKNVDVCVITQGEKGSKMYAREANWQEQHTPAVAISGVVDPTGAGDAFRAGFLYGYVRNWPHTQSAQLGSTLAAYAIEQVGTQGHRPSLAQIAQRYYNQYKEKINIKKAQ